eukprot:TRINITY_DN1724_c0_g2_i1.p1 TRINITY_DN1724_c0_g2~~TRINITY_DN1724_c0_g2_i1.p1  ORF type:complete len:686 (+),score=232.71 TRINITY_DN1724_c0_g2_i1:81-2138(+)
MKFQFLLAALAANRLAVEAAAMKGSPVAKVILYIKELEEETKADMKKEKESYTKYSEWCDATITTANTEIAEAKKIIAEQTAIVEKMSGKAGAALAEVEYLKKSIIENGDSQKQAETVRAKEKAKYDEAEEDFQEGIKAMKDMMKSLLDPSTASAASFLSTGSGKSAEARARSVATRFLKFPVLANKLSLGEARSLTNFAEGKITLAQVHVGQSLLDAPDSNLGGVINIIQQTIEDYEADLAVAVKDEEGKVANHEKLMKSLNDEMVSMKETLAEQMATNGDSIKALSDAKMLRHETEIELEADEKLLVETEDACELKKHQFDARTLLRNEELAGITKAIEILDSPEARAKFEASAEVSFLQLSSDAHDRNREKAYSTVKNLAGEYKNMALAQLAVQIKNHRGHFDKVVTIIDKQVKMLRDEMKLDVTHKDRCEKQTADNLKLIKDLTKQSEKAGAKIDKFTGARDELKGEYDILLKEMDETRDESKKLEDMRNEERAEFLVAVQHDKDALAIIKQAIMTLNEFYKNNKIELTLAQGKAEPAPDAGFSDKDYTGQQDKTNGVVRLLNNVKADVEDEIATAQKDDAKAQKLFSDEFTTLGKKLDSQTEQKVTTEKAMADLQQKIEDKTQFKAETDDSNAAAGEEKEALKSDCAWVKTKFAERRKARMAEINGLNEAKALLIAGESE